MCGIFGFSGGNEETKRIAPFLAIAMNDRGRDSWAMTDGKKTEKTIGSILDSFKVDMIDGFPSDLIVHTRAASKGSICIANQHPFEFVTADQTRIVGVHNGCISSHEELNKAHNRKFDVDSMHLYAHIAEGKPMTDVYGWGALAWFANDIMNFAKFNMSDFHIWQLESGPFVFCSTETPVKIATSLLDIKIKPQFSLDARKQYYIRDGKLFKCSGTMEFGTQHKPVPATTHSSSYSSFGGVNGSRTWDAASQKKWEDEQFRNIGNGSRNMSECVKCRSTKIDRRKLALCSGCLDKITKVVETNRVHTEVYA